MNSRIPNLFPLIAILASVWCCLVGGATEVQAGCGDYLTVVDASGNSISGHGLPLPNQPPCHGPQCSASPNKPTASMAPVSRVMGEEQSSIHALLEQAHWLATILQSWLPVGCADEPHFIPQIPFHPPRCL